jgi:hypothetical protein
VRLLEGEIHKIILSLTKNLKEIPHKLFLFGSRLDDQKRGGDIDLLLLVSEHDFEKVYAMKSHLKFDLEEAVGDQRVDLTLATEQKLKDDEFLMSIAQTMRVLEQML